MKILFFIFIAIFSSQTHAIETGYLTGLIENNEDCRIEISKTKKGWVRLKRKMKFVSVKLDKDVVSSLNKKIPGYSGSVIIKRDPRTGKRIEVKIKIDEVETLAETTTLKYDKGFEPHFTYNNHSPAKNKNYKIVPNLTLFVTELNQPMAFGVKFTEWQPSGDETVQGLKWLCVFRQKEWDEYPQWWW